MLRAIIPFFLAVTGELAGPGRGSVRLRYGRRRRRRQFWRPLPEWPLPLAQPLARPWPLVAPATFHLAGRNSADFPWLRWRFLFVFLLVRRSGREERARQWSRLWQIQLSLPIPFSFP